MNVILFTIVGALILVWGAAFALIKWMQPLQNKHFWGFSGYISVVCGALIFLVIQTSLMRQDSAMKETRARIDQSVEAFRTRLDELSNKLFTQVAEKADLTKSEWQVRADLQAEKAQHVETRGTLGRTRDQLRDTQAELVKEAAARNAYVDSLNTERAQHRDTRDRLGQTQGVLQEREQGLASTRQELARAQERLTVQQADLERLRTALTQAETRTRQALENTSTSQDQIQKKLTLQQGALELLQSAVDTIYLKVLKRPRVPGAED
ncbi:MAG: hypothetical protein O2954_14735 [bacterium]|nr:hypothetical protein [bacterium]